MDTSVIDYTVKDKLYKKYGCRGHHTDAQPYKMFDQKVASPTSTTTDIYKADTVNAIAFSRSVRASSMGRKAHLVI